MAPTDPPIKCLAVKEKAGVLQDWEYMPEPLGEEDIEIKVTHCGLCHSDLHVYTEDWGPCPFPMVPGHEIVGIVEKTGAAVSGMKRGDRVGFGWYKSSCGTCDNCIAGKDNICPEGKPTIQGGSRGGFAERFRGKASCALHIPDEMSSEAAAPLLCCGVTVFAPIDRYLKKPGMKVGVIGLGGLGHVALQFASRLGAEVIAISSNKSKEDEARGFGAHHFLPLDSVKDQTLDLILNTTPGGIEPKTLVGKLGFDGVLVYLGGGTDDLKGVMVFDLILAQRSIAGSAVGGQAEMRLMLRNAMLHHVEPKVELFPMSKANDAIEHLKSGKARYRIVLEVGDYFSSK